MNDHEKCHTLWQGNTSSMDYRSIEQFSLDVSHLSKIHTTQIPFWDGTFSTFLTDAISDLVLHLT